ncbi:MAG: glycosyltransferase family 4 protein [Ilumatobacter sp.]
MSDEPTRIVDTPTTDALDVAVNLLWCVPGQVGGSEEYLVRQLLGLADHAEFRPKLYCVPGFEAVHTELANRMEFVVAPVDGASRARRVVTEHSWLARRTTSAALVHHGGGTAPVVGGRPIVLTIHDIQYETYPHYVHPLKLRYLRSIVPSSARRAAVVVVPSEYVRGTVIERFGLDPDRVCVVRHGVEAGLGGDAGPADELRGRYGLGDGPVFVLPAITHPHKGHRFLLETMARHWDDPETRLVLLGGAGAADGEVSAAVSELGLADRVVRPGRVSAADRDGLIALADALVFPSEYEGFGAPVIEAMALGTPVVASDRTALPDVVGDAGLVLPLEHEAWADVPATVASRRDDLRAAGARRAATFTAAASGSDLAAAYRRAIELGETS